mgnify:CR=1 FL=1
MDDQDRRYTYIECLSNIKNVNGQPKQLSLSDPDFIDYYGRPWAKNWEKWFEKDWDKPESDAFKGHPRHFQMRPGRRHATLVGSLSPGSAGMDCCLRIWKSFSRAPGIVGTLAGAVYAIPQPFCSCCAAVMLPSHVRRGGFQSEFRALVFVVSSPVLQPDHTVSSCVPASFHSDLRSCAP